MPLFPGHLWGAVSEVEQLRHESASFGMSLTRVVALHACKATKGACLSLSLFFFQKGKVRKQTNMTMQLLFNIPQLN